MRTPVLAVVVALAACSPDANHYPELSTLYSIGAAGVECPTATEQTKAPDDLTGTCTFELVKVDGAPHCYARVTFSRPDASSEWSVVNVFGSAANCDY